MSATSGFNGERLREARELRGLTAIQLAELVGVTKQAISRYETSLCNPSPEILDSLVAMLRVPVRHFFRPIAPQTGGAIFYRSMAAATKAMRIRAERKMDCVRDILSFVSDYVDLPPVGVPDFNFPIDPHKITTEMVEEAAVALRKHWALGEAAISNMTLLVENHGAVASRFVLESDKLDSFSVWDDYTKRPLLILGADKQSAARSTFDAAHELGHLVIHRAVPKPLLNHKTTFALIEDQAHRFGRAFLLPGRSFSNDFVLPTLNAMKTLKPKWRVSIGLMIKRAEEIGLISHEQAMRLFINRSRQGWNRREPLDDDMELESPVLLSRSIQLLIESNTVSKDEIVNGVALYPNDIEALTSLPSGYLSPQVESAPGPEPRLLKFPSGNTGEMMV